ncbi:MAG: hypothetical protein AB1593_12225 [Pseudomonadota bacterium]
MARLDFDFHAAPARPSVVGLVLALAGAAALAWSVHIWQAARDREAGLDLQIAALENVRPASTRRAEPANVAAQETQARIAAQLAWRWQPAFDALSGARDRRIALVALDANQAKARLKLTAEARTLADAVAWIERLQAQPGVSRAALIQHELQADADQQPVRFVVDVALRT